MMNKIGLKWIFVACFCLLMDIVVGQKKKMQDLVATEVMLAGHLGNRVEQCITNRILTQDLNHIIEPFSNKTETSKWQSEFWGKWTLGACDAYRYNKSTQLYDKIKYGAKQLMKTQLPNGYIGNYSPEHYLAQWDIWGRKYSLLGLLAYYKISNDKEALNASIKLADNLLTQVGPGKANIIKQGNYKGLAASSVLEPIIYLYNITGDNKYLDFAKYIVRQWETEDGPKLISKSFEDLPIAERFTPIHKAAQWALNAHKSYEMMSCYVGLIELYKVEKNETYLAAAENTAKQIMKQEINIVGSASSTECFWNGAKNQTIPTFLSNETCVTTTWLQLCEKLFEVTGKVEYMDEFERTAYNALQASMNSTGHKIASYVPLEGFRRVGERQCGLDINCCEANGPRGFAMLPHVALMLRNSEVYVNLYNELQGKINVHNAGIVSISINTNYPVSEDIRVKVDPTAEAEFSLALRIPIWSKNNEILINGEPYLANTTSGQYVRINRKWKKGDIVSLKLDLTAKLERLNNHIAIKRGPIVLVRDSRYKDGFVDETIAIEHDKNNTVPLVEISNNRFAWISFAANAVLSIYNGNEESFRQVHLCDFGSAGNTWDENERYRTWLVNTIETADRETWW